MKRYGLTDMEQQAVFLIDKAGVIRYVHTTGPLGGLPLLPNIYANWTSCSSQWHESGC